jgi:DNA-binding GntR family transcriptional regulator
LEPGAYLDETELAEIYGISRPPLREVLRQLAGEGYVVLHENRGAQVAPMSHKTLRNFFVAAPMIYAATTRLAAENATPAQIVKLKEPSGPSARRSSRAMRPNARLATNASIRSSARWPTTNT